jgi:UDP-2,4-diacetamido-2,4,6-trideoxy-beta-L-altropyranose hydrolase
MLIVFRVDASLQIGTGHVMRCLTLADALRAQGAECHFICGEHAGNLIKQIRARSYVAHLLPAGAHSLAWQELPDQPAHAGWLGCSQDQDVAACAPILAELHPDWLVVDHYALDARWEAALQPHYHKLMVIDDLADRSHQCDLLLDQNFGRTDEDYRLRVPAACTLLCGSNFALLRPEFTELRAYSLQRRKKPQLKHLLISMGGVDKDNATARVLTALESSDLPADCRISVVMGATAPWLAEVRRQAAHMRWPVEVRVNVADMAQLMADSDLAIGAAGATSWERCCLGLPSIMLVLADNQRFIAGRLHEVGAATLLDNGFSDIGSRIKSLSLAHMGISAARIVDGQGTAQVVTRLRKSFA